MVRELLTLRLAAYLQGREQNTLFVVDLGMIRKPQNLQVICMAAILLQPARDTVSRMGDSAEPLA